MPPAGPEVEATQPAQVDRPAPGNRVSPGCRDRETPLRRRRCRWQSPRIAGAGALRARRPVVIDHTDPQFRDAHGLSRAMAAVGAFARRSPQEARSIRPESRLVAGPSDMGLWSCSPDWLPSPGLRPVYLALAPDADLFGHRARSTSDLACIFRHDPAPMDLDGLLGGAQLAGDFAVQHVPDHELGYLALAGASGSRRAARITRARRGRPDARDSRRGLGGWSPAGLDLRRVLQEIDRAGFHGADAHGHVPVSVIEHDGECSARPPQGSLQIEATLARELQRRGPDREGRSAQVGEKRLRRREGLDRQPDRAKQTLEGLTDVLIVVNYAHDAGVVPARKRVSVHRARALGSGLVSSLAFRCSRPSPRSVIDGHRSATAGDRRAVVHLATASSTLEAEIEPKQERNLPRCRTGLRGPRWSPRASFGTRRSCR